MNQPRTCTRCNGRKTIKVLGGGGDYEDWPCPDCRPKEHATTVAQVYSPGAPDGEAD